MRRLRLVLVVVAVFAGVVATAPASAQQGEPDGPRVIARKLADGRIEFAIRQEDGMERFPRARFFTYETARVDKWQFSSEVMIDSYDGPVGARVMARRVGGSQIEFHLISTDKVDVLIAIFGDNRFVNYETMPVGRWLRSSPAFLLSQRGDQQESQRAYPTDWFPPAGSCDHSPPVGPGKGSWPGVLFCTPPTISSDMNMRDYFNEFLTMVATWHPWIMPTLEWTGGYTIANSSDDLCPQGSAGCYYPGQRRIVIVGDVAARYSLPGAEETLIHEIAHAFDEMAGGSWHDRPSQDFAVIYPDDIVSVEVFAETLVSTVLGPRAQLTYLREPHHAFGACCWEYLRSKYKNRAAFDAMLNEIPDRPPVTARVFALWAISAWCEHCTRDDLRQVRGLTAWPSTNTAQQPVRLPPAPTVTVNIDFGCLDELLDDPTATECG